MIPKSKQDEVLAVISSLIKYLDAEKKQDYLKVVRMLLQDNINLHKQLNAKGETNEQTITREE